MQYLSLYRDRVDPSILTKWLPKMNLSLSKLRTCLPLFIKDLMDYRDASMKTYLLQILHQYPFLIMEFFWWLQTYGETGQQIWRLEFQTLLETPALKKLEFHVDFINQLFQAIEKHSSSHGKSNKNLIKTLMENVHFLNHHEACLGNLCTECQERLPNEGSREGCHFRERRKICILLFLGTRENLYHT